MKVKCEYCGNFMEDTLAVCPTCGAPNSNHRRAADDTPKTVAELEKWYTDHHLPPPEVTRFFIGVDWKQPKAFGIYQEGNEFVVYKNKADGQRAVRYRGTDEAYAVNELYMKLKEEILRQKNHNLNVRSAASKNGIRKNRGIRTLLQAIIVAVALTFIAGLTNRLISPMLEDPQAYSYYYNDSSNRLYFCCEEDRSTGQYEWWQFDFNVGNWSRQSYQKFPEKINGRNRTGLGDLLLKDGAKFSGTDIYKDRDFIDAGHHLPPAGNAYYIYQDRYYYYLDDAYASYGDSDNSGWYLYENDEWSYYCDGEDRERLGSGLWYSPEDYAVGEYYSDIYELQPQESESWVTDFSETEYYADYRENTEAYTDYWEEYDRNHPADNDAGNYYDNDDDYDWDGGDWDWDTGGDWDADW